MYLFFFLKKKKKKKKKIKHIHYIINYLNDTIYIDKM